MSDIYKGALRHWNKTQEGEYWNRSIHDPQGLDVTMDEELPELLRLAAGILANPHSHYQDISDAKAMMSEAHRLITVPCWVVVKAYSDPPTNHDGSPNYWHGKRTSSVGALDRAVAEELAVLFPAYYARKNPHHRPDNWSVERGRMNPAQVVAPGVTAAEFIARRLGN